MPIKDPEARRAYARIWMAKRRKEWFDANGPCVDCGATENLELDHVDSTLKITHKVWSWAKARRDVELAKCVVRCVKCHDIKTLIKQEYARGASHGHAKLTEVQVRELRNLYDSGKSITQLYRKFGISKQAASQVVRRGTWKHII